MGGLYDFVTKEHKIKTKDKIQPGDIDSYPPGLVLNDGLRSSSFSGASYLFHIEANAKRQ